MGQVAEVEGRGDILRKASTQALMSDCLCCSELPEPAAKEDGVSMIQPETRPATCRIDELNINLYTTK